MRIKKFITPIHLLLSTVFIVLCSEAMHASAADPNQFDLVCTATSVEGKVSALTPKWTVGHKTKYTIDLSSKKYCTDVGNTVSHLASVNKEDIVFEDFDAPGGTALVKVNRRSGELSLIVRDKHDGSVYMLWGDCVRQPFSGFPKSKF